VDDRDAGLPRRRIPQSLDGGRVEPRFAVGLGDPEERLRGFRSKRRPT